MERDKIVALNREDKYKIYFHYVLVQLSLKHNFNIRDISPIEIYDAKRKGFFYEKPSDDGWGKPDKVFGNLEFRYLWKDISYYSFEDFITIKDDKCTKDYLPMWEWYWRFEDEIVI